MESKPDDKTPSDKSPSTPQTKLDKSLVWKGFWENVRIIAIAVVIAFLIRTFIAEPRYIPSDSMLPTLLTGDRLVVEKVSTKLSEPHRGDVIVFEPPLLLQIQGYRKEDAFIKRIIGTSGDVIEVKEGQVYVNEAPLSEDYILEVPHYSFPRYKFLLAKYSLWEIIATTVMILISGDFYPQTISLVKRFFGFIH